MNTHLQRAVYDLMHNSRDGLSKIAVWLRKSECTLRKEANPNDISAKAGFVDVVEATEFTGNLVALNAFAAHVGCIVIKMPDGSSGDTFRDLSTMAKEFGEMVAEVSSAMGDARITDNELMRVEREAHQLIAAVQTTMLHLAAMNARHVLNAAAA